MNAPLLQAIAGTAFDRLKEILNRLGAAPPQVLLLEGGSEHQRRDMALYWAARINCPQASGTGSPCLACPACLQTAAGEHLDLAAYDGRISNREDEENPGPVRAFNMERVRELKSRLRDAPHGPGRRVVVLSGLSLTRDEAANALLKALEEPSATTVFVLLAPQREQLLPTLVSRSFCLTLPWPDSHSVDDDMRPWEEKLAHFLLSGQGLLDALAAKGALDATGAARLMLGCQKAINRIISKPIPDNVSSPLDAALATLRPQGLALVCQWLAEAQDALQYGLTPARVVEALAARIYALRLRGGG
ncbi:MAG: DNA polymerase III subunit delta' [Desulfovibrio sp.]|uniref:DNA polymerase III subunit delta' n=1 Tax=Desulfovibrio sp. TaxID=885 RepID=UPI0039E6010D